MIVLKFTIGLLSAISLISCAPTKVAINFDAPTVKVYDVNGAQDDLYVRANRWMVSIFKDARSVIQFSDKAEGVVMGKYLLAMNPYPVGSTGPQPIYALIEITVRDNKARISITPDSYDYYTKDERHKEYSGANYYKRDQGYVTSYYYTYEKALADINALCESFNQSLQVKDIGF